MYLGVKRAGYSVAEEAPVFLLVYALPAQWPFSPSGSSAEKPSVSLQRKAGAYRRQTASTLFPSGSMRNAA